MYTISTLNKLISVAFCNSFGIDIRLVVVVTVVVVVVVGAAATEAAFVVA